MNVLPSDCLHDHYLGDRDRLLKGERDRDLLPPPLLGEYERLSRRRYGSSLCQIITCFENVGSARKQTALFEEAELKDAKRY